MASGWEKINKLFRRRMALWFMIFDKCLSTQPQSVEICRRIPIASVEGKFACQSINALPFDNCMKWNLKSKIPPHTTPHPLPQRPFWLPNSNSNSNGSLHFSTRSRLLDFAFGLATPLLRKSHPALHANIDWVAHAFFFYSIIVIWQWRCSS